MAPRISTDDKGAAFRYVPWPSLGLTIPQILVGAVSVVVMTSVLLLLRLPMLDIGDQYGKRNFIFAMAAIAGASYYLAGPVTRRALSPETGLLYHLRTLVAESRAPRAPRDSTVRVKVSPIPVTRRNRRR